MDMKWARTEARNHEADKGDLSAVTFALVQSLPLVESDTEIGRPCSAKGATSYQPRAAPEVGIDEISKP